MTLDPLYNGIAPKFDQALSYLMPVYDADTEDVVKDLRNHGNTIDSLTTVWQSLAFIDRDTDEAEVEVYELINREIQDMGDAIAAVESRENELESLSEDER